MSEHVIKSHNKTLLLYHLVCPVKYWCKAITGEVEKTVKETCLEISTRYEIHFVEIGVDEDHVHFLVQSVPMKMPTEIVQTIKSIVAREIFQRNPEVKKVLWGGQFWTSGYYMNTVGRYGNEEAIKKYVKEQGGKYKRIYRSQLTLDF
jgi:putative transposase